MILTALTLIAATQAVTPRRRAEPITPGMGQTGRPTDGRIQSVPTGPIYSTNGIMSPNGRSSMRLVRTAAGARESWELRVVSPTTPCRVASFTTAKRASFVVEWDRTKEATILIRRDLRLTAGGDAKDFTLEESVCGEVYVKEAPWPNID